MSNCACRPPRSRHRTEFDHWVGKVVRPSAEFDNHITAAAIGIDPAATYAVSHITPFCCLAIKLARGKWLEIHPYWMQLVEKGTP